LTLTVIFTPRLLNSYKDTVEFLPLAQFKPELNFRPDSSAAIHGKKGGISENSGRK